MIFSVFINILCYILIFIFAAAAVIVLTLLFAPFYFKIKGSFNDKREGLLSFKWLFIKINAEYKDDELSTGLSYPFKRLIDDRKSKEAEKPEIGSDEGSRRSSYSSAKQSEAPKPKTKKKEDTLKKKSKPHKTARNEEGAETQEKKGSSSSYKEKLTKIISYENKTDIINCFVKNIKYIINKLKFKEFKINVRFGFGDPSLTGRILGLFYASALAFIKGISLEPDFTKAVFEADADIEGRGNLLNIIIPAVKFILNRNVRKLLFSKEVKNE